MKNTIGGYEKCKKKDCAVCKKDQNRDYEKYMKK